MKIFQIRYTPNGGFDWHVLRKVAQHAVNMLTDKHMFDTQNTQTDPNAQQAMQLTGFNTIITKTVEYSMTFDKINVICVGHKFDNATLKKLASEITSEIKSIREFRTAIRHDYYGSRGWCAAEVNDRVIDKNIVVVHQSPYQTKEADGDKHMNNGDTCLASIILDFDNTYNLPDGFEHPEYPHINDLTFTTQLCPIPLLYNIHSGFLQEIFYYLICHRDTPSSILERLRKLTDDVNDQPTYKRNCSSYCMRRCRCQKISGMRVEHRPIFPTGTRLPSVRDNQQVLYKRNAILNKTAPSNKTAATLDITYQTVAKGTSIAAHTLINISEPVEFKEWGSFRVLKILPHENWETVLCAANTEDTYRVDTDQHMHCAISGQPLYDDCYYVQIGPDDLQLGILISLFVAHHTNFLKVLHKRFHTTHIFHTCVPQTLNDILDTYMAEENPLYVKILRAAHYGHVSDRNEHLVIEHETHVYNVRHTGYIRADDHAVLCV